MNNKRLLIIDDDAGLLELLAMFFRSEGYSVESASTAADGLLLDSVFRPDVTILDVRLPDRGGLEVLEELNNKNSESRVIVMTASHDAGTRISAARLGACAFVTKPIDMDYLDRVVGKALQYVKCLSKGDGAK